MTTATPDPLPIKNVYPNQDTTHRCKCGEILAKVALLVDGRQLRYLCRKCDRVGK